MTVPQPRSRQPKLLDAGGFQPEIGSFRLHLAAEGKAATTVRTYTEAVQWFAAARLLAGAGRTSWEEVGKQDVQRVDRRAAGPLQRRVRQQPVPCPAAVLQVAGRRGRDPGPDGRAEAAARPGQARPGLHRRGPYPAGAGVRGPGVPPAPRRGHDRRVPGDRDPPVGAGRDPLRPRRPAAQRRGPVAPGGHRAWQGPQDPHGQDQPRRRPRPRPVHPRPRPARPGLPAAAVARRSTTAAR